MPYIDADRREDLHMGADPDTPGELNYAFSWLADEYLNRKGLSYQHLNDVIGALEGAKLELYRRVAAPYESEKLELNGDVYSVRLT